MIYKILMLEQWKVDGVFLNTISSVLLVLTSILIYVSCRRRRGIPPGPLRLPVVGNMLSLASGDMLQCFQDLRKTYGDVFSLYIGKEVVVVLNGYGTIHGALVRKGSQFVHRPPSALKNINTGILYCNGRHWKEQRTFLQKALQDVCLKNSARNIEDIIKLEVRDLISEIEEKREAFDVTDYVLHAGLNIMFLVTYGKRFRFGDKDAVNFALNMEKAAKQVLRIQILSNLFPFLQSLPGDWVGNDKRVALINELHTFARNLAGNGAEDKNNHNDVLSSRFSLADAFNDEIERAKCENLYQDSSEKSSFTEENREEVMVDLLGAGGDTTATSMMWVIVHLVREPQVQAKVFHEIQEVIGTDRDPCLEDRDDMPYTQAVILESLRITPTAPLALPHSCQKDTVFKGYVIPKDATVIANVITALKDPNVWPNPTKFSPERFLKMENGKSRVVVPEEYMPFSLGPRSCIGETVAKMEVFLTIVGLVQRFELLPADDGSVPEAEGELGITYRPKPFTMRFKKR